jgi:hypothetical protein
MKNWINRNYKTLIITAFIIPIITVAIVSISHVAKWYGLSNPVTWAIYLSIGIEIAALSALAAISADMGRKVYFPFFIVTLIQFIGNIFFAYSYIDINSTLFKDWVDLVSPLVSYMGVDENDFIGHKRFLSLFAGGMLPVISLSFLHMLVKFTEEDRLKPKKTDIVEDKTELKDEQINKINASDLISEVSKIRLSENDLKILEDALLNPPKPNENLKRAIKKHKEQNWEEENNDIDEEIESIVGLNTKETSTEKSIFPKEVEYPEEYNRPVYPTQEERKQLLVDMMQQDQELGLYDEPYDNPMIKEPSVSPQNDQEMMLTTDSEIISSIPTDDEISDLDITSIDNTEVDEITPALSDEEIKEMFMDEWERKFDTVEEKEEGEMSIEEIMEKFPENFEKEEQPTPDEENINFNQNIEEEKKK